MSPADQRWAISRSGYSLRALGRLSESIEPLKLGAESAVELEDWKNAVISFVNLSQLYLALARIPEAIDGARRSLELADRSRDARIRLVGRTVLADALHQSGDVAQPANLFDEAERMQVDEQPDFPILYSVRGYLYRDLLLAQGQTDEVFRRSVQTLDWESRTGFSSTLPSTSFPSAALTPPAPPKPPSTSTKP